MKKSIKLISFVLITVLCLGIVPTVFAEVSGDPYKIYRSTTYAETNTATDFTFPLYNRSTASTAYADLVASASELCVANASNYKYIIVDVCVKPDSNVKEVYLSTGQSAVSDRLTTDYGLINNAWNNIKFICEYLESDETSATYKVSSYINGLFAKSTTKPIKNKNSTTARFDIRFYINKIDDTTATADIASMSCYATNTDPSTVYSVKNVDNSNYAIDGGNIYVKSGITTAKALCDAVIGDNTDSVQAKIMPKDKNTAADYTDADTYTLENGDSIAVRTLQSDGKYKKTLHTINLDKTAVILSGDSISSVKQNYSDDFTGFDDAKSLKATAYAKDAGKIYFAQYDVDGNLLSVDAKDVAAGEFASVDFAKAEGMSEVKTFLWNNASFAPLAGSQVLKPIASSTTAE